MEAQMTYLRPTLSPTGPPTNVPMAVATRKTNKKSVELQYLIFEKSNKVENEKKS